MGRVGLLLWPKGQAKLEFGVFYFGCLKFAYDGDKHFLVVDAFGDLLACIFILVVLNFYFGCFTCLFV